MAERMPCGTVKEKKLIGRSQGALLHVGTSMCRAKDTSIYIQRIVRHICAVKPTMSQRNNVSMSM